MNVTADDLDAAISSVVSTLHPATSQGWSASAGTLDWDCWHTAEHISDCLLSYAAQFAVRPATRYVRFLTSADKDASPAEVLEFAEAGGRILAAMDALRHSCTAIRNYSNGAGTGLPSRRNPGSRNLIKQLLASLSSEKPAFR